jgi:hypothetical protein
VFKIEEVEGGIGVPKRGGPRNSTRAGLLTPKISGPFLPISTSKMLKS